MHFVHNFLKFTLGQQILICLGARDGKKLGFGWDPVNSIPTLFQPGPFQSFSHKGPEQHNRVFIAQMLILPQQDVCQNHFQSSIVIFQLLLLCQGSSKSNSCVYFLKTN